MRSLNPLRDLNFGGTDFDWRDDAVIVRRIKQKHACGGVSVNGTQKAPRPSPPPPKQIAQKEPKRQAPKPIVAPPVVKIRLERPIEFEIAERDYQFKMALAAWIKDNPDMAWLGEQYGIKL